MKEEASKNAADIARLSASEEALKAEGTSLSAINKKNE
eukprot:CAMPEP_0177671720 /NCGR_PEP_ID=MMETSP0447-20121125/24892_1 /TAXON_ID=0 /ORGANISM="Stygamoeba regulata, Strain BSH-02190019" /LENGTH=37 /DNA_ID= /DNA_START= /DNA_END= /DNA_ORIENTATION=